MKEIRVEDAVGQVLCHDMTRIVKGEKKSPQFKKGHVIKAEDIPMLLSMGKENIYVWEKIEGMLHENEAAEILRDICQDENMGASEPSEGKIEITANCDGLLKVDIDRLTQINSIDEIIIATRHNNTVVASGDKLAATRAIPLVIAQEKLDDAKKIFDLTGQPILKLLPFRKLKAALITTGSEVFHGRITDTFTPVIIDKLTNYNIELVKHCIVDDDDDMILQSIQEARAEGVDMILCTGGMSVDPDDKTPGTIKKSGATIVTYGAPVLPGAMFLLGYYSDGVPIMGLPGCVMYAKATIFDMILPRIVANDTLTKKDFVTMGHGGLCLDCVECHYPNCGFGKGN